jgi:hypothetical protein
VQLKPGTRFRSQVCTTEVIVVRAPADDLELECGGVAMVASGTEVADGQSIVAGFGEGSQLGKRYTTADGAGALELLVTKAGEGSLAVSGTALVIKDAKPLPASD